MRTAIAVSLIIHGLVVVLAFRMKAHRFEERPTSAARVQITIVDHPHPLPLAARPPETDSVGSPISSYRVVRAGLARRPASRSGDSPSTPPLDVPDKSSPSHDQDESSDGTQAPTESELHAASPAPVPAAAAMPSAASSAPSGAPKEGPHWERIGQAIRRQVIYPLLARRRGMQGRTTVGFVVGPSGMASDVRIVTSSGYPLLDAAALKAVSRAVPLPVPSEPTEIVMPIVFTLQ